MGKARPVTKGTAELDEVIPDAPESPMKKPPKRPTKKGK